MDERDGRGGVGWGGCNAVRGVQDLVTERQSYRRVWLSPGVTVWLGLHSGGDLHVLGPFPPTLLLFPYSGFT